MKRRGERLRDNTAVFASDRGKGVPREGPALLQAWLSLVCAASA